MKLTLSAYGIARDIMDGSSTELDNVDFRTTGELKQYLKKTYPQFKDLLTFSLAVREEYREDDYILQDQDEVVIIPPVSGG